MTYFRKEHWRTGETKTARKLESSLEVCTIPREVKTYNGTLLKPYLQTNSGAADDVVRFCEALPRCHEILGSRTTLGTGMVQEINQAWQQKGYSR